MKRILIVEDETAIREFEAINLKRVGYDITEAGSGEEALEIYDNDFEGFEVYFQPLFNSKNNQFSR